jgi:hypothetical protein
MTMHAARAVSSPAMPAAGLALLLAAGGVFAATGDLEIVAAAKGSEIKVRTCSKYAGAVCSIIFRGKEHIDVKDAGRLLQSASSFDRYGECYNPTEGGSERDRFRSSSALKAARAEGNWISTTTDMAYWLRPGAEYPRGCGARQDVKQAVNTAALSPHRLDKRITVGLPGFPNVIEHRVTYHVPKVFSSGVFEASTGYMPKEFSLALYFDPVTGAETVAGQRQGEQALPVILATPDRRYAMGVYSPQLPQGRLGYGRFFYPDVVKWNCVFREEHVKPGPHSYRCLIPMGTVDEVQDTIRRLHAGRHARQPGNKRAQ